MPTPSELLAQAHKKNDPTLLATLSLEELQKLNVAEAILEARHQAQKRANRIATLGGMLVGYVALAGFFANAYQNYLNKQHLQAQSEKEEARWKQEFDRTRRADKYHAFFETSALVTDAQSSDRRLVGLALLDEFVADPDYHQKAVAILDQSLARELKESEKEPPMEGLSEGHRAAISEVVQAMSATTSCHELQRAAESINRVVAHAKYADPAENLELFTLYSRRLVGRAAVICKTTPEFQQVRNPVREALLSVGRIEDLQKKSTKPEGSKAVADLLLKECVREVEEFGGRECAEIRTRYQSLCKDLRKDPSWAMEQPACEVVDKWPAPPPEEAPAAPAAE
jgi:hypothetical protein